jgi:plastocyanin
MQSCSRAVHRCTGRCGVSRRRVIGVLIGMVATSVWHAAGVRAESTKTIEIHIDNFAFTPAEVTISPGTTVTWVNRDDIPHAIAEKGLAFKSKAMDTDESFTHTFDAAGEIDYFCSLHPHMTGKIIVKSS